MGEKDLYKLYPLYRYLVEKYSSFHWQIDSGHFETAIAIEENTGEIKKPPKGKPFQWNGKWSVFVPDIYSYTEKVAIEYQEQPKRKKHRGRLSKKGHTEFSDEEKDSAYKSAGIQQIKIWDDDEDWKKTIDKSLVRVAC